MNNFNNSFELDSKRKNVGLLYIQQCSHDKKVTESVVNEEVVKF